MDELEGLWTVSFQSNFQVFGNGVAIFTRNRILGGDSAYYYRGNAKIDGSRLEASLNVVRFNKEGNAIFGNVDSFNLSLSGEVRASEMELSGNMVEQPMMKITINCKKITSL